MESLRLDGTTIRGLVKGRPVNCIVRSVPDGLVLPRGQYLLRVGENNPIYGLFLAVEATAAPGSAAAINYMKMAPSALKDSPAAAIATLVPAKPAYGAILKEVPGAPAAVKYAPASKVDAPAALKYAPAGEKYAPAAVKYAPAAKFDAPAAKFDAPAYKADGAPAAKFDAPAYKADGAPSAMFDAAASAKFDGAPSAKFDFVAGQGMTARVIIAIRPIGQNALVAQAGFSDLVDAVQQAGGVTLIVA